MKRTNVSLVFFAFFALTCPDAHADSLSCNGGIVSVGDSRVDLVMKCGEPDGKDSHDEEIIERLDRDTRRKLIVTVDEWNYNFGPGQFMRIITLKNGKITDIRAGNYGHNKGAKPGQRECDGQVVSIGDSKSEVILKCGEPAWKDIRQEETKERLDPGLEHKVYTTIEEWTYNLGPNRFVRILTFRNSKLVDIRTGGYGYEMKKDKQ